MEILGKLLGTPARVKIMRLFLLNPVDGFESSDIVVRSKISSSAARSELALLASIGFIKKKAFTKEVMIGRKGSKKAKSKRVSGWMLNSNFRYLVNMRELLIGADFLKKEDLVNRFKGTGRIKLLVTAGIFTRDPESRVDILLVGDNLRRSAIEQNIKALQAEIGKELTYAIFETSDFIYRVNMYDKLVRDILDFPHEKLIETPGLSTQALKKI